jgi:hypothetical protein
MMDQENYAGRFSAEVDRILEQHGRAEDAGPPPEYGDMLILAERLAALDFSPDSQVRRPLRDLLSSRLETQRSTARLYARWRSPRFSARRSRALVALVALTALVMLAGWTPAGRAVAEAVGEFIQEIHWSHTTVQQVPPHIQPTVTAEMRGTDEAGQITSQAWEFTFEGRTFSGCCSPEVRNEVVSLPRAIEEAGFAFQLPARLPAGFVLSEVRLLDIPPYHVLLTYDGTAGHLGLYQFSVGVISEQHPGGDLAVIERRQVGVFTDRTVEEVMVGSVPAALIDQERLVWEKDGISFHLIGPGLDVETLVQIAESLVPAK